MCPQCGIRVFGRPGATEAACPHCGRAAAAVLPAAAAPPVSSARTWTPAKWALIALAVVAVLGLVAGLRSVGTFGKPQVILASGRAAAIEDVPTPIRVYPIIRKAGRRVVFDFAMTDARGNGVRGIDLGVGRRMPLPRIAVLDAAGRTVHTGRFEYG